MARKMYTTKDVARQIMDRESGSDVSDIELTEDESTDTSDVNDNDNQVTDSNDESNDSSDDSEDSDNDHPPPLHQRVNIPHQLRSKNGRIWSTNPERPTQARASNVLRQQSGLSSASVRSVYTIFDSFKLFFTNDMILLIVRETNRRGQSTARKWNQTHERTHGWRETDSSEIEAMIGLLILAGMWRSSGESLDELWSAKDGRPVFRATMSLTRFKELLRYCRFDNQATREQRISQDKLAPIRDFWVMFLANLQPIYKPGSDISRRAIDSDTRAVQFPAVLALEARKIRHKGILGL